MKISQGTLEIVAIVYAGIALLLSILSNFVLRVPSRAISYLQWSYLFSIVFATTTIPFSQNLKVSHSIISFKQADQYWFCKFSDFTCELQFGISFAVILAGVILIMRLVTIPEKVREKGVTFERTYRLLKGLIRWFYLPFAFLSIYQLINKVKGEAIPAAVILAICFIFPIVQVALYKRFDAESTDPWIKWIEFASYSKDLIFALLLVLAFRYNDTPFFYIPILIIGYGIFYGFFYQFKYPIVGRVFWGIGDAVMYFLCSLFVGGDSKQLLEARTYLDIYLLGAIILIDLVYLIIELIHAFRNRQNDAEVVPEDSGAQERHKNRYEANGENFDEHSRDNLNLNESKASSKVGLGKSGSKTNITGRARRK